MVTGKVPTGSTAASQARLSQPLGPQLALPRSVTTLPYQVHRPLSQIYQSGKQAHRAELVLMKFDQTYPTYSFSVFYRQSGANLVRFDRFIGEVL